MPGFGGGGFAHGPGANAGIPGYHSGPGAPAAVHSPSVVTAPGGSDSVRPGMAPQQRIVIVPPGSGLTWVGNTLVWAPNYQADPSPSRPGNGPHGSCDPTRPECG
ncbi:hypothetical protein [Nocardia alni]|uniref:hypothetical protein n=1 Tax=Nocardia alni TaxID=2815723 RepID=UPI001C210D4C|nr:hypothetical protein [Nocardia alni]